MLSLDAGVAAGDVFTPREAGLLFAGDVVTFVTVSAAFVVIFVVGTSLVALASPFFEFEKTLAVPSTISSLETVVMSLGGPSKLGDLLVPLFRFINERGDSIGRNL